LAVAAYRLRKDADDAAQHRYRECGRVTKPREALFCAASPGLRTRRSAEAAASASDDGSALAQIKARAAASELRQASKHALHSAWWPAWGSQNRSTLGTDVGARGGQSARMFRPHRAQARERAADRDHLLHRLRAWKGSARDITLLPPRQPAPAGSPVARARDRAGPTSARSFRPRSRLRRCPRP